MQPTTVSIQELIEQFDGLLFDAYGVLVDACSALPGAVKLIEFLNCNEISYRILTNGSCFSPAETAVRYQQKGLMIPAESVITSGSLVAQWVKDQGLIGARTFVMGPPVSCDLMKTAGLDVTDQISTDMSLVIIANQDENDYLNVCNRLISAISKMVESTKPLRLLLPNPDIIYPAGDGNFGLTSGSIALIVEEALKLRFGSQAPTFERLGKPYSPIFTEAKRHLKGRLVMIGDQIPTDIIGAKRANIASALVTTGLTGIDFLQAFEHSPDFILSDLALS